MKHLLVVLIIITLPLNSSSAPKLRDYMDKSKEDPVISPVEGKSVLVVIRKSLLGAAVCKKVYLEERLIGATMGYTYFKTVVEPGTHYILSSQPYDEEYMITRLHMKPGKIYYLEHQPAGFVTILHPITENEFNRMSRKSKYSVLRSGVTESIEKYFVKFKKQYLESLKNDPKKHEDNENYEGF